MQKFPSIEQFRHVVRAERDQAAFENREPGVRRYRGTMQIHPMMQDDIERMTGEDADDNVPPKMWAMDYVRESEKKAAALEAAAREQERVEDIRRSEQAVLESNPLYGML